MRKIESGRRTFKVAIAVLLSGAFLTAGASATMAGNCGGHCQQIKVCTQMVKQKGLKDHSARQAEWNKCMTDPHNYQ